MDALISILRWSIVVYFVLSITISVTAWNNSGLSAGLSSFGASALAIIAGGGLKASFYGDSIQKIGGVVIAAVLLTLAIWIARGFSVSIGGTELTGLTWTLIGAVACFLFVDRKLAS